MTRLRRAGLALAAALCAVSFTATADARGGFGGHIGGGHMGGGHMGGHFGHVGHVGHWGGHGGHWGHGHWHGRGIGFYPYFGGAYYDDYYGDDDCYRVYRYGRWRVVCDD